MEPQTIIYALLALWCAVVLGYAGWCAWREGVVRVTLASAHGLAVGDWVRIYGVTAPFDHVNGLTQITSISANSFTYRL